MECGSEVNDAPLQCVSDGGGVVACAELFENALDVIIDRIFRDAQFIGDLRGDCHRRPPKTRYSVGRGLLNGALPFSAPTDLLPELVRIGVSFSSNFGDQGDRVK